MANPLARLFGRTKAAEPRGLSLFSGWLANYLWLVDSAFLPLARDGYGRNPVAYTCIRLLSQSVAEPPLVAYTMKDEDTKDKLPYTHAVRELLRRPNELMTEYEFWEMTTMFVAIAGKAPWWKQRDNAGRVRALWPLRPDRVAPIYSSSNKDGERVLYGWAYYTPGTLEPIPIARRDMLVFNFPDPAGETGGIVEGIGPLQVLAAEISADLKATEFVGSLVANYATPGVVLKVKSGIPDKDTADRLKRQFMAQFGGTKRGEPMLLDENSEFEALGFNMQQLEFPALRDVAESRIAAAFGVPAILAGLKVGLDRSTFANMAESREFFAETTLSAYWRRFSDQITEDVAAEFGDNLVCEFDMRRVKALANQRRQEAALLVDGFKNGVVTVNEYRTKVLDWDEVDTGDVFLRSGAQTEFPMDQKTRDERKPDIPPPTTPPQLAPGEQPQGDPPVDQPADQQQNQPDGQAGGTAPPPGLPGKSADFLAVR